MRALRISTSQRANNKSRRSPVTIIHESTGRNREIEPEGGEKKTASKRKRETNDENDASNASKAPARKRAKSSNSSSKSTENPANSEDLFSIHLEGDEDNSVPIFDSCDVIREKIDNHLTETGITKAQFLRDIARAAYPSKVPTIQTKQLNDFVRYAGATTGNSNRVYYAAYVYFEKKRISEGQPKSEHRRKMEKQWAPKGMSRKLSQYYWCRDDEVLYENEVGVVRGITKKALQKKAKSSFNNM